MRGEELDLLAIVTKNSAYINDFYSHDPVLRKQSFAEQKQALVADTFGGSEIWSAGLSRFGYQTERVFSNVPNLQTQWAVEQGIRFDSSNWVESILRSQVINIKPRILVISNFAAFTPQFVKNLKEDVPTIELVIGWCSSPYRDDAIFREYDLIISSLPKIVTDLRTKGHLAYYLNHAFDPRVLENIDTSKPPHIDLSFMGSIVKSDGFHFEREALLLELIKTTDIEIWAKARYLTQKQKIKILLTQFSYDLTLYLLRVGVPRSAISKLPLLGKISLFKTRPDFSSFVDPHIAARARPPVFGLRMFQKLRDSKVTLNTHGDIASKSAANMRLFEATGVGTCLLTDWKENLGDLFDLDSEVVAYRDSDECVEKARYLLENENERCTISQAGQKRVMNEHTIYHRAEQLDQIIRNHLSGSR